MSLTMTRGTTPDRHGWIVRATRRISLVALLSSVSFAMTRPTAAQGPTSPANCPGAPKSRLIIGTLARIEPDNPDNIRDAPTVNGRVLGEATFPDTVTVLAGPHCADNYAWWQVSYGTTIPSGWVAEGDKNRYFLMPTSTAREKFIIPSNKDSVNVKYGKISFTYSSGLYGTVVRAYIAYAINLKPNPALSNQPKHTEFFFEGPQNATNSPTVLSVYLVADYQKIDDESNKRIAALTDLLSSKPAQITTEVPVLPVPHAGQVFHPQISYLTFDGGTGIRFVARYAQDAGPITNTGLAYAFQGLTTDGKYFVSAYFPITAAFIKDGQPDPDFPDMSGSTAGDLYQKYIQQKTDEFNQALPSNFTPPLDGLDALIQSLKIQ